MRIAVWSGPRNLSTAMMYSFGNRADMSALDEPFYGAYLKATGLKHPMTDDIIQAMECDPDQVARNLESFDTPHQYEKHMMHHMLPDFPLDWMADVVNVFLLRHPARVLASYLQKHIDPTADDLGFTQIDWLMAKAKNPILIDSGDIRDNPERALKALCASIGISFDPAMITWPKGPKPFDGAWAPHWYDAVHGSTGFAGAEAGLPDVPKAYSEMLSSAVRQYDALRAHAL